MSLACSRLARGRWRVWPRVNDSHSAPLHQRLARQSESALALAVPLTERQLAAGRVLELVRLADAGEVRSRAASMSDLRQRKAALRKRISDAVDALSDHEVQRQSSIVVDKVLKHPIYKQAKSVSIYLSFDKEVQTGVLVEDILKNGKICYIPRFQKGVPDMEMIKLHSLEDYNSLPVNKWNIKQPSSEDQRESVFDNGTLDLVLAPGQAFTKDGVRLGRGKGYYDKFLAKCFQKLSKRPVVIGLSFKEQIVPEIPQTETDVVLDEVLFEGS